MNVFGKPQSVMYTYEDVHEWNFSWTLVCRQTHKLDDGQRLGHKSTDVKMLQLFCLKVIILTFMGGP